MAKAKLDLPQTEIVPIATIQENETNPRYIKDDKFKKLVKSIKDFPEMLQLRPIIVNDQGIILGGNMRYKACVEAGLKEIPIIRARDLTEKQQREFIIKDNVGFGEWDFEILANEWNTGDLADWGLDLDFPEPEGDADQDDQYTRKIESPAYTPTGEKPAPAELYNDQKTRDLIAEIKELDIPEAEKAFLIQAAHRHTVFNYAAIAEYYSHSSPEVQNLMENSALVIIDFNKAIDLGYVELTKGIAELYNQDYNDETE